MRKHGSGLYLPDVPGDWSKLPIVGYTRKGAPVYAIAGGSPAPAATMQRGGHGGMHGEPGATRVARRPQTTADALPDKFTYNMYDTTFSPLPGVVNTPLKAVPGFVSRLRIQIIMSGGAINGTNALYGADNPDAFVQTIRVADASGYPTHSYDGAGARLVTMFGAQAGPGGYRDTHNRPSFSQPTSGNFKLVYDVPFESGLGAGHGCIAGADQSKVISLQMFFSAIASAYSTSPGTVPTTMRIRVDAEFYGAPLPPHAGWRPYGYGSSVQWGMASAGPVTSGGNQSIIVPAPNLTGYIGTLIFVFRKQSDNTREDTILSGTDDIELWLDQQPRLIESFDQFADRHARHFELGLGSGTGAPGTNYVGARPTGVAAYSFRNSVLAAGPVGLDTGSLWIPTNTGTLGELKSGGWGGAAQTDLVTIYSQRLYEEGGGVPIGEQFRTG